jgi:hypothetical protein
MQAPLPRLTTPAPTLFRGRVLEILGPETVMVAGESEVRPARRAASCLISPSPGDEVLCALDGETAFILAVLTLADPWAVASCRLPARSEISADELSVKARELSGETERAGLKADRLALAGDHLTLSWRVLRLAAGLFSAALGSLLSKTKTSRVVVESTASLETGRLSVRTDGDLTARSASLDIKAEGPVVIDGRALRLG